MECPDGSDNDCLVIDVSTGGAGIETRHDIGDVRDFELTFLTPGFELSVRCQVRGVQYLWQRNVIHAQFASLDDGALVMAFVEALSSDTTVMPSNSAPWERMRAALKQRFRRRAA